MAKIKILIDDENRTGARKGEVIEVSDDRAGRWSEYGWCELLRSAAKKSGGVEGGDEKSVNEKKSGGKPDEKK